MQLRGGRSRRGLQERGDDAHVEDGGEAGDDEEAEVARDHRAGRGVARLGREVARLELEDALQLVGLGVGLGARGGRAMGIGTSMDRGGAPRRARPVAPLELLQALLELRVRRRGASYRASSSAAGMILPAPWGNSIEGPRYPARYAPKSTIAIKFTCRTSICRSPPSRAARFASGPLLASLRGSLGASGGIRNVTLAIFVRRGLQLGEPESAARCSDAESPSSAAAPLFRWSSHPNSETSPMKSHKANRPEQIRIPVRCECEFLQQRRFAFALQKLRTWLSGSRTVVEQLSDGVWGWKGGEASRYKSGGGATASRGR